jgi:Cu(I)/Ag(I) efflux system membrane fusion protein
MGAACLLVGLAACGSGGGGGASAAKGGPAMAGRPAQEGMPGMPDMEGMPSMDHGPGSDTAGVPMDRAAAQRLGISFARAALRPVAQGTRVAGILVYAEPRRVLVSTRVTGWVEELYADYTGKPVREGDGLLALYAPELVSAQEEYLAARRLGDAALAAAARRRLELWDIPEDQIAQLEQTGQAQRRLLLRAPIGGEIAEKMVTAGQAVQAGDNLFLIADRSLLWTELAIFEAEARLLRVGMPVELTVEALPGRTFAGRVSFLHPGVDAKTRTLTARVEVPNRDGRLRPGMYVTARLASAGVPRLAVPLPAVLPTGTRSLVFVNRGDGRFVPREVEVGARNDSLIEIVKGLQPGDEVVASATYLLDSESNLAAAMQGIMLQMGMGLDMGGMRMEPGKGDAP